MEPKVRAPFAEAMRDYAAQGRIPFHTPGHKQGAGAHPLLRELVTAEGLRREVSVAEALDDLCDAEHCLKDAQELTAKLYGAKAAFFAVNGTTGAIHAMLTAALSPGDKVLTARNIHRSVLGGLILVGAEPIYVQPSYDVDFGIALNLTTESVEHAVREHPTVKALIVTSPNYYGVASDLTSLADVLHRHDMLLLVDEAHGAHLRFSPRLPRSAIECGADLVAQSTHKLLGALTQASVLLLGDTDRIDAERLHRAVTLLTTTSPNNFLLASLDIARLQMAEQGEFLVNRAVKLAERVRDDLKRAGLRVLPPDSLRDTTKITVSARSFGLTGAAAAQILRRDYNIEPELADAYNLLFIISYADTEQGTARLVAALTDMSQKSHGAAFRLPSIKLPPLPQVRLSPRDAFFAPRGAVPVAAAVGKIAAEQIMFYPPGIPLLCPGEEIDALCVDYIRSMQAAGCKVAGAADLSLQTLQVVVER